MLKSSNIGHRTAAFMTLANLLCINKHRLNSRGCKLLGAHELEFCKVVTTAVEKAGMPLEQHVLSQPATVHSHRRLSSDSERNRDTKHIVELLEEPIVELEAIA